MGAEHLVGTLAVIGIVIIVTSLLSGALERSGVPPVAVFLVLGAVLGPYGLGLVELTLRSPALQVMATLGLVLVLFSDAITIDIAQARRHRRLAVMLLGPGTLVPAALTALAAWLLLDLSAPAAAVLGAALASTDPVLLRSILRRGELPAAARLALRLESGANDVVLLPVIVIAMLLAGGPGKATGADVARHALGLFLLGPGLGALVGWGAITILEQVRRRTGVRRDYESLYALGVAFTAYAVAERVGGSGYLAGFTAGLVIAALDVELCDCFLDYGQATAEVFLLFTFVAFGGSLIWSGIGVADARTLAFAVIALAARPLVLVAVLGRTELPAQSRRLITWLGPRGLSSLLLILLPVFGGMPGAERLFAVTSLVVLLSVVVHGAAIAVALRRGARAAESGGAAPEVTTPGAAPVEPTPVAASAAADGRALPAADGSERITIAEVRELWERGEPVVVVDARSVRTYDQSDAAARDAVRLPPDDAVRRARQLRLAQHATLVVYCA